MLTCTSSTPSCRTESHLPTAKKSFLNKGDFKDMEAGYEVGCGMYISSTLARAHLLQACSELPVTAPKVPCRSPSEPL